MQRGPPLAVLRFDVRPGVEQQLDHLLLPGDGRLLEQRPPAVVGIVDGGAGGELGLHLGDPPAGPLLLGRERPGRLGGGGRRWGRRSRVGNRFRIRTDVGGTTSVRVSDGRLASDGEVADASTTAAGALAADGPLRPTKLGAGRCRRGRPVGLRLAGRDVGDRGRAAGVFGTAGGVDPVGAIVGGVGEATAGLGLAGAAGAPG